MDATGSHDGPSAVGMMEGLQIGADAAEASKPVGAPPMLLLTDQERQILDLYDRLEEIQLEASIFKAEESIKFDRTEFVSEQELRAAQDALLEARSLYTLRNTIIESVLMANPILRTVHAATRATAIERDLLPLIQERDSLSMLLSHRSEKILATREKLTQAEVDHIIASRKNADLATTMIALAEEANLQKKDDIKDLAKRQEIAELEASLKISRQRWRIMKGTASAVVAGSGIDWARDEALRELVLDDDSD